MVKYIGLCVAIITAFAASPASGEVRLGDVVGGLGLGFTSDPTTLLLTPQAEYVYRPNLFFGPLAQIGLGSASLFAASAAGRLVLGRHPQIRPSMEAGLGLAAGSGFNSSIGLLLHFGVGFDYMIGRSTSVGTLFRANFIPPMKTFLLSWPVVLLRILI